MSDEKKTVEVRLRGPLRLVLREGEEVRLRVLVEPPAPRRDVSIEKAIAAMKADPARRWTVEALAELARLSRAAFARRFGAATGTSPMQWLGELRLRLAAERLLATDDALAAVGAAIGYESEFAFARAFKRRFGLPPGVFRRTPPTLARAA